MRKKGFTLIELLVVIAIIGILSSVVLAALNTARLKSRDALRVQELDELQTALEDYYADNGAYPVSLNGQLDYESACSPLSSGVVWNGGPGGYTGSTAWIPNLAPKYIPTLPTDPSVNGSTATCFTYYSSGTNYLIWDHSGYEEWQNSSTGINNPIVRIVAPACTNTENTYEVYSSNYSRCN
jgi:prepilin-type N-terminal cleavage/methylation domain-containing protein